MPFNSSQIRTHYRVSKVLRCFLLNDLVLDVQILSIRFLDSLCKENLLLVIVIVLKLLILMILTEMCDRHIEHSARTF